MRRSIKTLLFLAFVFVFFLISTALALAKPVETGLGTVETDPKALVNAILRIALGVAGGVAFLMIVYGGFKLAFSKGDPEAVQEGREKITSAIIGLLIIIFSVFLLRLIGIDILGLPLEWEN